jgi:PKD repeat protein
MRKLLSLLLILLAIQVKAQAQCNAAFTSSVNQATATFQASGSLGPTYNHYWYFGDNTQGYGTNVSHTYNASGVYTVVHVVTDSLNTCFDSLMSTVTINVPATCNASYVYYQDSLQSHLYHFTSTSTANGGTINSYNWKVNGNTVSTTPALNYTLPVGPTSVCLTITTTAGCSSTTCDSVIVADSNQCNANAAFNASVNQATATFQSTGSTGPNFFHQWKFGDNTQGWGANVSHTYQSSGVYTVWHIVTDSINNCRDSVMKTVTINVPATCHASFNYYVDSLQARLYHFISTSTATGGSIQAYNWKVNGVTVSTSSTLNYTMPVGNSVVCLTILTTAGCSSTACDSVIVADSNQCNANAAFNVSVNQATATFQATGSIGSNFFHQWKFGDNTQGWGTNVSHTYQASGVYNVWHIVTDSINNCRDSALKTVTITVPATCHASFVSYRDSLQSHLYHFISTSTSTGGSIQAYNWKVNGVTVSTASTLNYTLPAGNSSVCLTILTTAGCSSTACDSVMVVDSTQCNWTASFTTAALHNNPKKITFFPSPSLPHMKYQWKIMANGVHTYNVLNPVHTFPQPGTYNVWLSIIDTTNQCMDSVLQQVQVPLDSLGGRAGMITSYPNPVTGDNIQLRVQMQQAGIIQLVVYNTSGNIMNTLVRSGGAGTNLVSVPVSSLQRGQYFVEIRYGNERKRSIFQKL